jgi:hypothetical protein
VHCDDVGLAGQMAAAARVLNIKPHLCGGSRPDGEDGTELAAPCDIEAHRGTDGR